MAKQSSYLKITGTLDGLTFYKNSEGHFVRTKGGVTKGRIMSDPAYVRTRENIAEFGTTAQSGKLLRLAIGPMLHQAKDSRVSSRMLGVLSKVRKLDQVSARGQRKVGEGLITLEGKQLLKGFDFNQRAPMQTVLQATPVLETTTGIISFSEFVPADHLIAPEGATHVSFRSAFIVVDFTTGAWETKYSNVENLKIDHSINTVKLTPVEVPNPLEIRMHFLFISFYQEVNSVQYPLRNGAFNVLNLIEII